MQTAKKSSRTPKTVGARIAHARAVLGLTQVALDTMVKTRGLTWMLEADGGKLRKNPRGQTVAKYAKALGVSMEWLVTGEGEGPRVAA